MTARRRKFGPSFAKDFRVLYLDLTVTPVHPNMNYVVGASVLPVERWWVIALVLALTAVLPRIGDPGIQAVERAFRKLARRRCLAICLVFFGAIGIRAAMLPILGVPAPQTHDEFSYLLQGDIFAHGRLAFPTHPMAPYFETFHVNFWPTYSSIYPPAQAATLALGQLLGNPWIGVLLSSAAMSAAFLWMLQGWVPPQWALLGAVLMTLRLGLFTYWINSYWGGTVAAAGAALVIGAFPRVMRRQRAKDAALMGIGVAALANSRYFEGFIFCLPVAVALLVWMLKRYRKGLGFPLRGVLFPLGSILVLALAFSLYYNWRVTNNPFEMPHSHYIKQRMGGLPFLWQKVKPRTDFANPQFRNFYDTWVVQPHSQGWPELIYSARQKTLDFWKFFIGPIFSLGFLGLPWVFRDRRMRLLLIQFVLCAVGLFCVIWFEPHYAAPLLATLFIIAMQSMRHLRQWKIFGRPVGVGWTRAIVLLYLCATSAFAGQAYQDPLDAPYFDTWAEHNTDRVEIIRQLNEKPGDHLVLVRYSEDHDFNVEWVYNAADIDRARIVWAREIPGKDLASLFAYYPNRSVWVLEPDVNPDVIYPYEKAPPLPEE
jgi:hypothetical protein